MDQCPTCGAIKADDDSIKRVVDMIVDMKTATPIKSFSDGLTGNVGFIGFTRLVAQFRAAGEFNENETVTHLRITDDGIEYRVETEVNAA